jgi:hypothetical protein
MGSTGSMEEFDTAFFVAKLPIESTPDCTHWDGRRTMQANYWERSSPPANWTQLLINAVTGKVGPGTKMSGYPCIRSSALSMRFSETRVVWERSGLSVLVRILLRLSTKARVFNPAVNVVATTNHIFDLSYGP